MFKREGIVTTSPMVQLNTLNGPQRQKKILLLTWTGEIVLQHSDEGYFLCNALLRNTDVLTIYLKIYRLLQ